MKIGEAQTTYSKQIRSYNSVVNDLRTKKQELNDKINRTENGAVVYQNEAAILELQYDAVDKKRQEYQDYMDKLLEQKMGIMNMKAADQQADAMAESAKEQAKVMEVARRIMHGDKVPAKDEKKLMEFDYKLYAMAKNAAAMLKYQKDRKEHKSLWDDEAPKENVDVEEETDNTEAFADGPEVVDVGEVMASATSDISVSVE